MKRKDIFITSICTAVMFFSIYLVCNSFIRWNECKQIQIQTKLLQCRLWEIHNFAGEHSDYVAYRKNLEQKLRYLEKQQLSKNSASHLHKLQLSASSQKLLVKEVEQLIAETSEKQQDLQIKVIVIGSYHAVIRWLRQLEQRDYELLMLRMQEENDEIIKAEIRVAIE